MDWNGYGLQIRTIDLTTSSDYESINQPKIDYILITGDIKWILNDTKENLFTSFDLDGHLEQAEKFGVFKKKWCWI